MGNKYLTLSFDDGLEQDKKIIRTLEKYNLHGCTFNINCGMLGNRGYIGRIGSIGWKYVAGKKRPKDFILKYLESHRMPEADVRAVYQGYEIAGHEAQHRMMTKMPKEELKKAVREELERLSDLAGDPVVGYAYPFGAQNSDVAAALKSCGILYARTVANKKDFARPEDPLNWSTSTSFIATDLFDLFEKFLASESDQDQFFSVWGHGYEFDFGTKNANWNKLERFCKMAAGAKDVTCCTNREFFEAALKKDLS